MNSVEPRKILTLKKKLMGVSVQVVEVPKPTIPTYVADAPEPRRKPQKKASKVAPTKVDQSLQSRLIVHAKATKDLKSDKHPMRIVCLDKMLLRLNKHLLLDNSLAVSYDENDKQILTNIND